MSDDTLEKGRFTAKEQAILDVAWLCLKTGPPEIDIDRLTTLGGFNTRKTASNTWWAIKKKLGDFAAESGHPFTAAGDGTATPKTASAKKRVKKTAAGDDEAATPVKKRARQTPVKSDAPEDTAEEEGQADADD